jgi:predicted CXXCH cytochrome family protein
MRWAPPLLVGALFAWLTTLGLALGGQGTVVSSEHDLGVPAGGSGVSACEICHIPHDASGETLWARGPYPEGEAYSGSRPVCYSCHDGTVTAGGAYAFDESATHHPITPGEPGEDCDMCHEPHVPDFGSFLLFPAGANLCKSCHAHASEVDHPVNVDAIEVGYAPLDSRWSPGEGDSSGTRLWDESGFEPGSYVKCLSCHAGHGAEPDTPLLTMSAVESDGEFLCVNCHLR